MRALKVFLLLGTLTSLTVSYKFQLVSSDKETIYTWKASIKAGTHLPTPFASQLDIEGKIHFQPSKNSTLVKIKDLNHGIYSGKIQSFDENRKGNLSGIPLEAQDLQNTFRIVYSDKGLVEAIVTRNGEKEFSRNIKKGIASVFQINNTVFGKGQHMYESFASEEKSIHGFSRVIYEVISKNEKVEVVKLHELSDPLEFSSVTNTFLGFCDVNYEQMVMHDSRKKYQLIKDNSSYIIKHIEVISSVVYYPFKAKSDAHIVLVNQSFDLAGFVITEEEYQMIEEHQEESLTYQIDKPNEVINLEEVRNILIEIPRYIDEEHLTEDTDVGRRQLVNRVQNKLQEFTLERLEELTKTLTGDSLGAFYQILPLVGTDASTLHIKNLVINKFVSEEIASELLQHVSENIKPSPNLLTKLEDLIHLDETFTWDLNKVAILSFASLIHKSSMYTKEEKLYEKYVTEYLNKLTSSNDFKDIIPYLLGLRNMKLSSLAKLLVPTFNGEWWHNQHLRYMGIWAASPSIIHADPEVIMETFWPIFTNREEILELRILTYYYIMIAQPSYTRLRNIFMFMLTEPNEELYSFHYTYAKSVMQSTDPCAETERVKLAQLLKFSPPPKSPNAFVNYFGYTDPTFGFSTGIENYYLKTNRSRLHAVYVTTQQFNRYQEEYVWYWKIHDGKNTDEGLLSSILTIFKELLTEGKPNRELHIEASFVKRGQIINTYFFDGRNLKQLYSVLEIFEKQTQFISKNLLHIGYERYDRSFIPTDLGVPVLWEYLMPDVHRNKIAISKRITGNHVIDIRIDSRYVNSIHSRHGLSFYNPLRQVWQGINRYQSYDFVLPINLNVSVKTAEHKLEISWTREDGKGVFGVRSHVDQAVFVGSEFQVVSDGKNFRRNYSLIEEDHLDTGHKLHVGIYDSSLRFPYGKFQNQMSLIVQTANKNFDTPLQHWILVWSHFHRHLMYLPEPGTYGFIVKGEPSKKFNVTDIDLTIQYEAEADDITYYLPGLKLKSRISYRVKTLEKILKSWDFGSLLYIKHGHDFGVFKSQITRKIPDEEDYEVYVIGNKTWEEKKVSGFLNLAFDKTRIDVRMVGDRSYQQKGNHYQYPSCQNVVPFSRPQKRNIDCLLAPTTIRNYTYNVRVRNLSEDYEKKLRNLWEYLKDYYQSYYVNTNTGVGQNSYQINILYPVETEEVDINISTSQDTYQFSGVPLKYLKWFGFKPDSTIYPVAFLKQYKEDLVDHCRIFPDHHLFNEHFTPEELPNQWFLYVEDVDTQNAVYLKLVSSTIVMKIIGFDNSVEIVPDGDGYQMIADEENLNDWIYYRVLSHEAGKPIMGLLRDSGIHFEYDGRRVEIVVPKEGHKRGHCYNYQH